MNVELKERWATALESGNYPQALGALKTDTGFCCLGVLCDVSGEGTWCGEAEGFSNFHYVLNSKKASSSEILPKGLLAGYGAQWSNVSIRIHTGLKEAGIWDPSLDKWLMSMPTLTDLNDSGVPFAVIAKLIREDKSL